MAEDTRRQDGYGIRFEWGPVGAAMLAREPGVLVVVDVLSFTTSVTVALERGSVVYPAPWHGGRAAELAREHDAGLAVARLDTDDRHPWSLSPAALLLAPAAPRLVLPSPNGSAIAAAAAAAGTSVVAACLRNAHTVAAWLAERYGAPASPVTVIAAGERWADGSLRPALEDLLGAGAVISHLARAGCLATSPEAAAARGAFEATHSLGDALRACASGRELSAAGFGEDVEVAGELDASRVVPVLVDGAFRPAVSH